MSRFVPGLGHAYAGRRGRALIFILLFVAWNVWTPSNAWEIPAIFIYSILSTLILVDSFRTLRKSNVAPRKATLIALLLILSTSQAFLIAKGLQIFAYGVYRIPSSAMEPTLLGNISYHHRLESCPFRSSHVTSSGDRILVSKLAYVASPIERFDVAAFRFPLEQSKSFVKRIVGMPGEKIQIHQGDLYVRVTGEPHFRIVRKPMVTQDAIWIPVEENGNPLSDSTAFRESWELAAGDPGSYAIDQGMLEIKNKSEISFRLKSVISDSLGQEVDDTRLSIEIDFVDSESEVFAERINRYGRFEVRAAAGGKGALAMDVGNGNRIMPFTFPALRAGQRCSIDFLVFDGAAYVRMNGILQAHESFIEILEDSKTDRSQSSRMSFGMKGGRGHISRILVGRDIHYRGNNRDLSLSEDSPVAIPEGTYMVFGDNVANSHDSRAWVKRTFILKDGRTIVCEAQQINESYSDFALTLQEKYHLASRPDIAIDGDEHGNEVALFRDQIARQGDPEPFRFIERRFVVGRVQKIWWPISRARAVH